ncbi:hypothetical protein [Lactobacillus iners]|nr:hypothetical protein [Lactobacillus iners]
MAKQNILYEKIKELYTEYKELFRYSSVVAVSLIANSFFHMLT